MIYTRYQDFRAGFGAGSPVAADGFPTWPYSSLRASGFSGMAFSSIMSSGFPFSASCNVYAADAVAGVDDYDWYVSQRTDVIASHYFTVSAYSANHSGSISVDVVDANVKLLIPALASLNSSALRAALKDDAYLKLLFKDVAFYAQRRSDGAYQWSTIWSSL